MILTILFYILAGVALVLSFAYFNLIFGFIKFVNNELSPSNDLIEGPFPAIHQSLDPRQSHSGMTQAPSLPPEIIQIIDHTKESEVNHPKS